MTNRIIGLAGSASFPSKTRSLIETATKATRGQFGGTSAVYDLTHLQPSLGQANGIADLDAKAQAVIEDILAADALIVGSPVYKGSYTGLFKHLFDLLDPSALAGKPVLLVATGGGDRHALVVEHQLRPLLAFFEAASLPTAVYASSADFAGGRPTSPALLTRLGRAINQFAPWLAQPAALPSEVAAE